MCLMLSDSKLEVKCRQIENGAGRALKTITKSSTHSEHVIGARMTRNQLRSPREMPMLPPFASLSAT